MKIYYGKAVYDQKEINAAINVLKRKCPEVFETHLEDSSRFCLGITICIQSLCKFQIFKFLPIFSQNHNF